MIFLLLGQRENKEPLPKDRHSNIPWHNNSSHTICAQSSKPTKASTGYRGYHNNSHYTRDLNSTNNRKSLSSSSSSTIPYNQQQQQHRNHYNIRPNDRYINSNENVKTNGVRRHSGSPEMINSTMLTTNTHTQSHKRSPFSQRNQNISRNFNSYGHHNSKYGRSRGPSYGYQRSDIKNTFDPNYQSKCDAENNCSEMINNDNSSAKRMFNEGMFNILFD